MPESEGQVPQTAEYVERDGIRYKRIDPESVDFSTAPKAQKLTDVYAVQVTGGTHEVTTRISGQVETTNIAKQGDWIVYNIGNVKDKSIPGYQDMSPEELVRAKLERAEAQVVTPDKFAEAYSPKTQVGEGFVAKATSPERPVVMQAEDFVVRAPWGEDQFVRAGGVLVNNGPGDTYGIAKDAFENTYGEPGQPRPFAETHAKLIAEGKPVIEQRSPGAASPVDPDARAPRERAQAAQRERNPEWFDKDGKPRYEPSAAADASSRERQAPQSGDRPAEYLRDGTATDGRRVILEDEAPAAGTKPSATSKSAPAPAMRTHDGRPLQVTENGLTYAPQPREPLNTTLKVIRDASMGTGQPVTAYNREAGQFTAKDGRLSYMPPSGESPETSVGIASSVARKSGMQIDLDLNGHKLEVTQRGVRYTNEKGISVSRAVENAKGIAAETGLPVEVELRGQSEHHGRKIQMAPNGEFTYVAREKYETAQMFVDGAQAAAKELGRPVKVEFAGSAAQEYGGNLTVDKDGMFHYEAPEGKRGQTNEVIKRLARQLGTTVQGEGEFVIPGRDGKPARRVPQQLSAEPPGPSSRNPAQAASPPAGDKPIVVPRRRDPAGREPGGTHGRDGWRNRETATGTTADDLVKAEQGMGSADQRRTSPQDRLAQRNLTETGDARDPSPSEKEQAAGGRMREFDQPPPEPSPSQKEVRAGNRMREFDQPPPEPSPSQKEVRAGNRMREFDQPPAELSPSGRERAAGGRMREFEQPPQSRAAITPPSPQAGESDTPSNGRRRSRSSQSFGTGSTHGNTGPQNEGPAAGYTADDFNRPAGSPSTGQRRVSPQDSLARGQMTDGQPSRGAVTATKPHVANEPPVAETPTKRTAGPTQEPPPASRKVENSNATAPEPSAGKTRQPGAERTNAPAAENTPGGSAKRNTTPTEAPSGGSMIDRAGQGLGYATAANRMYAGYQQGDTGEVVMGAVEGAATLASNAKQLKGRGGLIGVGVSFVDGIYQTGKAYSSDKTAGENFTDMTKAAGRSGYDATANVVSFGMAGGSAGILSDRKMESTGEMIALGYKAIEMAAGKRDFNANELLRDGISIVRKDASAMKAAAAETTPVRIVRDGSELVSAGASTVALHYQESGRFNSVGRSVEDTLARTHDTERAIATADKYPKMTGLGGRFREQLGDETGVIHWEKREVREKAAKMFEGELKRAEQLASDNAWYKLGDSGKRRGAKADADIARSALDELSNAGKEFEAQQLAAAREQQQQKTRQPDGRQTEQLAAAGAPQNGQPIQDKQPSAAEPAPASRVTSSDGKAEAPKPGPKPAEVAGDAPIIKPRYTMPLPGADHVVSDGPKPVEKMPYTVPLPGEDRVASNGPKPVEKGPYMMPIPGEDRVVSNGPKPVEKMPYTVPLPGEDRVASNGPKPVEKMPYTVPLPGEDRVASNGPKPVEKGPYMMPIPGEDRVVSNGPKPVDKGPYTVPLPGENRVASGGVKPIEKGPYMMPIPGEDRANTPQVAQKDISQKEPTPAQQPKTSIVRNPQKEQRFADAPNARTPANEHQQSKTSIVRDPQKEQKLAGAPNSPTPGNEHQQDFAALLKKSDPNLMAKLQKAVGGTVAATTVTQNNIQLASGPSAKGAGRTV